jgi:hypothetical protein
MRAERRQAIREALASLALTHASAVVQLETAIRLLSEALDVLDDDFAVGLLEGPPRRQNDFVDMANHSVRWEGKTCFLGNSLPFRFFERISRSPNQYISYRVLLNDVWGGEREHSSIHGVAKRLRDRLNLSGMNNLSEKINGTNPGHYCLLLG